MPAKFGYNIKTLANNNFLNTLKNQGSFGKWEVNTNYSIGDRVYNGLNKYIATAAAIDTSTGPTHTSGFDPILSPNPCNWLYYETYSNTEIFRNNFYAFLGKKSDWPIVNEVEIIADPITEDVGTITTINDIMTLKKIQTDNFRMGIRKFAWSSGAVYDQYDPTKNPFASSGNGGYEYPFYCVSGNYIYKCLNNNNGAASTSQPPNNSEPESTAIIINADNYSWKYMGKINTDDLSVFGTDLYTPVQHLLFDDLSTQWDVQTEAKPNGITALKLLATAGVVDPSNFKINIFTDNYGETIDTKTTQDGKFESVIRTTNNLLNGTFTNAIISTAGWDYNSNNIAIICHDEAVGSGAFVYPSDSGETGQKVVITNGIITAIDLADVGIGYNDNAKVVIVGTFADENTGIQAELDLVVNPQTEISEITIVDGGFGYTYARVFIIPGPPTGTYPTNLNLGGAVTELVLTPLSGHGYNLPKELGANALLCNIQTPKETVAGEEFLIGQINSFRQFGIITDIKAEDGVTFANDDLYIGPSHPSFDIVTPFDKISPDFGEILYLSNFGEVIRSTGTSESISITIVF